MSDLPQDALPGTPPDMPSLEPPDSPSVELTRILTNLDRARRRAMARSLTLIEYSHSSSAPPGGSAPAAPAATAGMTAALEPSLGAAPPAAVEPAAQRVVVRLRGLARPVSTVVVTTTLVLLGWLLVLEPALGSRPVLVMDDGMSPALRIGDVAFAEEPVGPLASGAIVAVRSDGRVEVTRLIDREPVPAGASAEARADAPLVVRDDAAGLEVRVVVPRDALIGVIGAAVPRVGLPAVWLRSPTTAPLGTLLVLLVLWVSAIGIADGARERAERRRGVTPSA
jgi:hypothetical protein